MYPIKVSFTYFCFCSQLDVDILFVLKSNSTIILKVTKHKHINIYLMQRV